MAASREVRRRKSRCEATGFTAAKRSTSALLLRLNHRTRPYRQAHPLFTPSKGGAARTRGLDSLLAPSRGVNGQAQSAGVSAAPSAEGRTSYPRQQ